MINLIIDGKNVTAKKDTAVLEAARAAGINIPTLCAHESVSRSGACRLCVVEIKKGNRTRIVTSCLYNVEEGLIVDTKSERVAKCPPPGDGIVAGALPRIRSPTKTGQRAWC